MTRNNSTWTWLLTSLGAFALAAVLAGGARAQGIMLPGFCPSEFPASDRVRRQGPGGTAYLSAIFEGIYYENDSLQDKQQTEWDREFLSSIRRKYPGATISPETFERCSLYSFKRDDYLYYVNIVEGFVREFQAMNWRVVFMDWIPSNTRLVRTLRHEDDASEGEEEIFGPKAGKALNAWRDKHGIEDQGAIAKTLMLMVQTALALQSFDPGPADGVFGKRTLAAIAAWQTMQGFPEGGELAGLIAAILRAALVLEGYDPGPVEEMFGPSAIEAAQVWAPSYEKVMHSQATSSSTSATTPRVLPSSKNCLSIDRSAPYWVYMVNRCSFGIDFRSQYEPGCGDWNCSGYMAPRSVRSSRPPSSAASGGMRARHPGDPGMWSHRVIRMENSTVGIEGTKRSSACGPG